MIGFFRQHQSHRIRAYDALPVLLDDGLTLTDEEQVDWDVEMPRDDWQPRDVGLAVAPPNWPLQPCRFIDGKDVGDTVAWLQSEEGYPVPVRLSQIGAIAMRVVNGELRREDDVPMERVVSMIVDLFPWDEIENLARDLRTSGFRLLPSELPLDKSQMFDFERMRKTTQNRSNDEMIRLERQTLARVTDVATVVDGRLEPRADAFDAATAPVIGVIKTHSRNYLHAQGWRVFYNLKPGERTPAVLLEGGKLKYEQDGKVVFTAKPADIQEIAPNIFFGLNTGTFHIILNSGKTYNFVSTSLSPADTNSIVESLHSALK